jgi:hypothetical protein
MWKAALKSSFLGTRRLWFFDTLFAYAQGGLRAVRELLCEIPAFRLAPRQSPGEKVGRESAEQ